MRLWMRFVARTASEPEERSGVRRFLSAVADAFGRIP
jgi:hypothetical protein